jgi:hypothetical protein
MNPYKGDPLPQGAKVGCIACSEPLYFLPDSYPLAFHCGNGHFLTVPDLLDGYLPQDRKAPMPALELWKQNAILFHRLAAQAMEGGHALVAADFQETAGRIDQWVAQLRTLLHHDKRPAG